MVRAIILDCFGVSVTDALTQIIDDLRGSDPEKADEITRLSNEAGKGLIEPHPYRAAIADVLELSFDEYMNKLRSGEHKNHELLSYIKTLRPQYKIGVLSNVSAGGLKLRFSEQELRQHFDTVVASGEIGYAKPEAQAYEIAASSLGVRLDECVMVDDRQEYCDGAIGVGMQAILYIDNEQLKTELKSIGS